MEKQKESVPVAIVTLTVGLAIALVSFWFGQNNGLMPEQASVQAGSIDRLFDVTVGIGMALFILVEGAIVYAAIAFRRRRGDNADAPHIEGNLPLEAFWTAVPAIVVIGIGIYSVQVYQEIGGFAPAMMHDHSAMMAEMPADSAIAAPEMNPEMAEMLAMEMDAEGDEMATRHVKYGFGSTNDVAPAVTVNVQGMQFAWLFEYPETGITTGTLHVPVDKKVQLDISALDVIHSFWVPQFRLKQDAIPGQPTQLSFTANKIGTYPIVCAELCGSYHGSMRSEVVVESEADYRAWLEENAIAQAPAVPQSAIAARTADLTADLGVNAATISQLQEHSEHQH